MAKLPCSLEELRNRLSEKLLEAGESDDIELGSVLLMKRLGVARVGQIYQHHIPKIYKLAGKSEGNTIEISKFVEAYAKYVEDHIAELNKLSSSSP